MSTAAKVSKCVKQYCALFLMLFIFVGRVFFIVVIITNSVPQDMYQLAACVQTGHLIRSMLLYNFVFFCFFFNKKMLNFTINS